MKLLFVATSYPVLKFVLFATKKTARIKQKKIFDSLREEAVYELFVLLRSWQYIYIFNRQIILFDYEKIS